MNIRQIQEAREQYGIDEWGAGYFGINDQGHVVSFPTGIEHRAVDLHQVMMDLQSKGVSTPVILRFPQIVAAQLDRLHSAFREAIFEYNFKGRHLGVFPFKVNQRREFIDSIVECGAGYDYGLEVGSKTEFMAALSYELPKDALLIANGFKDREFIDIAYTAKAIGKRVVIVVEGPDELQMIFDRKHEFPEVPEIGLRVKLYSKGSGKWEKSSGDTSKFGLTTSEVLHALSMIEENGMTDKLAMLHFHIGSQITEIKRFKNALKEASRVYSKVVKMGFKPDFLNIGGGVGVDYDGSKTSFASSANYSLQEFVNDAVYVLGEVCNNEGIEHPTIVTESGRVIAAYHSVVVTDVREVQGNVDSENLDGFEVADDANSNKSIRELKYIYDNINRKNYQEYYHDAIAYQEEIHTLFNLGYLNLEERSASETLFGLICRKALYFSSFQRHPSEEFESLQKVLVSQYLANFSIFQSIPDAWSIDQMFPVMPLSRHQEKPTLKSSIVDITCDSDGCLDRFIDRREVRSSLDLHTPNGHPYFIGFFLVGAYQESLANEHNLFGAINEAEVILNDAGGWEVAKITNGDPIDELLQCRNYDKAEMLGKYQKQFDQAVESLVIPKERSEELYKNLEKVFSSLPYLQS